MARSPSVESDSQHQPSSFRQVERHYKARTPPGPLSGGQLRRLRKGQPYRPSLEDVWDVRELLDDGDAPRENGPWGRAQRHGVECVEVGLDGRRGWAVKDVSGLVVFPQYFSPSEQRTLVKSCLATHTQEPNKTNLHQHYHLPAAPCSLWSLYSSTIVTSSRTSATDEPVIHPRHTSADRPIPPKFSAGRTLVDNTPGEQLTLEEIARAAESEPEPSSTVKPTKISVLMKDLRWTNIGLFYDWTSKNYDFKNHIPFPPDLEARLSPIIKHEVSWELVYAPLGPELRSSVGFDAWGTDYQFDAGIINFYQTTDSLMAHVDRSELDPYRPLVSVSLGLSAVFLLGGTSRDESPLPILLRSGDVIVISGPSRRAYHGVPRVLDGTLPDHFKLPEMDGEDTWDPAFFTYLETTRININARQVFPPSFDPQTLFDAQAQDQNNS